MQVPCQLVGGESKLPTVAETPCTGPSRVDSGCLCPLLCSLKWEELGPPVVPVLGAGVT